MRRMDQALDEIRIHAEINNVSMAKAAAITRSVAVKNIEAWDEPEDLENIVTQKTIPDVISKDDFSIIADMARDAAACTHNFPLNTAYLHGLGVAASAMTKSFRYQYYYDDLAPVNLYVCTAQPPSSGKSRIDKIFLKPIKEGYKVINKINRKKRRELTRQIEQLEKDLKNGGLDQQYDALDELIEKRNNTPIWKMCLTDVTPESAENEALAQTGMFNIISSEAASINTIIGKSYGDDKGGRKANFDIVLKAFDGEHLSSSRITREGFDGEVRATVSVIAQKESVESVLEAGARGVGLAERFLLISEPDNLGNRDFTKRLKPNSEIRKIYADMIQNVLSEDAVILRFSEECFDYLTEKRMEVEKEMGQGGKYEHNLLTGFMGKMDKQIFKIASVLHISQEWQLSGQKRTQVNIKTFKIAVAIFEELSKTYINAADTIGCVGEGSELDSMVEAFSFKAAKGELALPVRKLIDDVKKKKTFVGIRHFTRKVKESILPKLEEYGYCVVVDNKVYINPRLK